MHAPLTTSPPNPSTKACANANCGRIFIARRPWQLFCSLACQVGAHRRLQNAVMHPGPEGSGLPEIANVRAKPPAEVPAAQAACNAFLPGGRSIWRQVLEVELGAHQWRPVRSSDGVVVQVAQLRLRGLGVS
jgi:hypothetical protein